MANSLGSSKQAEANYKLKYKLLKRCIKDIVLENAALCDRASEIQHQILVAQEERKFLWKKYTAIQGNNLIGDDILGNAGTTSHPLVEQKKTARKATTPKHSTTKPPRQSLPRTKQKRKLDESLASESLPLANS